MADHSDAPDAAPDRDPKLISKEEAVRRHVQHLYLYAVNLTPPVRKKFFEELKAGRFTSQPEQAVPRGVQKEIRELLQEMTHDGESLDISKQVVHLWAKRVKQNGWEITNTRQDYTSNIENATKFRTGENRRVREELQKPNMKCGQIVTVHSDKEHRQINISESSVRRIAKRKFGDEPSLQPAVPKPMKIQGDTAHHNKCRLVEAERWLAYGQDYVDGLWFADESKMKFSPQMNKKIDIQWTLRGNCGAANWYEKPTHTAQINLFLVINITGVVYHKVYPNNMKKVHYTNALKHLQKKVNENAEDDDEDAVTMTCFVHDNLWGSGQPKEMLNRTFGDGKWTQYMGEPCYFPHKTKRTPVRHLPTREYKQRCPCEFPDGPVKASYCPKTNLTENCFAQLDRILLRNQRLEIAAGKPAWPKHGQTSGDRAHGGDLCEFWKKKLKRAVRDLNQDKQYFRKLYATFLDRCKLYTSRQSRGKRLKTTKY